MLKQKLGYDKDPKYLREFKSYKNQLLKSYINDSQVTDNLVEEAYNRMQVEVNASHVLIRIDENSLDTLEVYNKLMTIKSRIENEGFEKVKKELHNGKTVFAEDLGYFSVFRMVYLLRAQHTIHQLEKLQILLEQDLDIMWYL